jgi:superfamily I DNA/RNA helicase
MNMPRGVLPVLVPVRAAQDEIGVVTAEIAALHKSGYPLRNILVLARFRSGEQHLYKLIEDR